MQFHTLAHNNNGIQLSYIHSHTCLRAYTPAYIMYRYKPVHAYVPAYTYCIIHTYLHTYIHTYTHTYIRRYFSSYLHTYPPAYIPAYCLHVYIYTCVYMCIYIYTHVSIFLSQPNHPDNMYMKAIPACMSF